ncbi:type VI secretion system membrane subunit TssM [soil metagenome]
MKKLFSWLLNPWLLAFLGLLAFALLVWIIGPLVAIGEWHPLDPVWARIGLVLFVALLYVFVKVLRIMAARRRNRAVVGQLMARDAAPGVVEPAEVGQLRDRFEKALETLKAARIGAKGGGWSQMSWRFGSQYLYQLPWFVIFGAPGSGKTTALLNSGLTFPLAEQLGNSAIKGVGGTRNCDWWFTDQAVLLDTAGRYALQESNPEADKKAWGGFIDLLKRTRPRRPINGAFVTLSVTDLLTESAPQREAHATALRARIQELQASLGLRFPIYVLITKCDLLSGFMDYFADTDKTERAQPWGMTFDYQDSQAATAPQKFAELFDRLTQRLLDGLVDRTQQERDDARRARIYGFAEQFGGLREAMLESLQQIFQPNQFHQAPLLRGVYFISGTQEGTPIDRMLGTFARDLRLERAILPPNQNSGKSFFLNRALSDIVFPESELAGTNLAWERRRKALAFAGYALVGLLTIGLLAAWTTSYIRNRAMIAEVNTRAAEVKKLVESTPNRATPDVAVLLPALNAMLELRDSTTVDVAPLSARFGLFQGSKLEAAAKQAYERMLTDALMPRLSMQIEQQLKLGAGTNPEWLYEALKAYVMIHTPERFDAKGFKSYVSADWEANLSSRLTPEARATLEKHLDNLVALGTTSSPLAEDKQLVANARAQLANTPLAQRIYNRLLREGVGASFPEFTIAKAGGPSAPSAFIRASGTPINRGVPGLFTFDGYWRGFQPAVDATSKQLADEEGWVLGLAEPQKRWSDLTQMQRLTDDVRRLYLNEYARTWEGFIADIRMQPAANLQQSVQTARILSAADNPLVPLTRAMVRETTLLAVNDKSSIEQAQDKAVGAVQQSREQLLKLLGGRQAGSATDAITAPEHIVDDRFTAIRAMVTPPAPGQPAPIEQTVALINEAYTMLNATEVAVRNGNAPPPSDVGNKIRAEAARLPEPIRSLLGTLSTSGATAALGATRTNLGTAINAQIGEFCRQATPGRYPFARTSTRDVTTDDFARLFAPGGLFDDFFTKNLAQYVDTSTRPWSFKQVGDAKMGDDNGTLIQFQRAAVIRDTFFRNGGRTPSLKLDFKPIEMDTTITQFALDVDGQPVRYSHGPQMSTPIAWPGPRGSGDVRIQLSPMAAGGTSGASADGPWALFRMLDKASIEALGAPERFKVTFNIDGRRAAFEVTASSVLNPFRLKELSEFACPGGL